jgi:hypothetical protein
MIRLPVGAGRFTVRPPTGEDDVLLLEGGDDPTGVAVRLLQGLASPAAGGHAEIGELVLTDFQVLLLHLYRVVVDGPIEATTLCARAECGCVIAVSLAVAPYIAHHLPRTPSTVAPDGTSGWWRLAGEAARYRLPTSGDLVAARRETNPEAELRGRCLDPADMPVRLRRRAERAMAAQAPNLSQPVQAICPECGTRADVLFDVEEFVLTTLRAHAAFIYEDIHLLALHYHWPEATILSMPRTRRIQYTAMLRAAT